MNLQIHATLLETSLLACKGRNEPYGEFAGSFFGPFQKHELGVGAAQLWRAPGMAERPVSHSCSSNARHVFRFEVFFHCKKRMIGNPSAEGKNQSVYFYCFLQKKVLKN